MAAKTDLSQPMAFLFDANEVEKEISGCKGVPKKYVDALESVARQMGDAVVNKDQESIFWFFNAFDELKRLAAVYWQDEHGEYLRERCNDSDM